MASEPGTVVLVHSSLSAMGWVCGGAVAAITALQGVLGSSGTLVMPAHSPGLSEPGKWQNPPVPESWWPVIRENLPAYDRSAHANSVIWAYNLGDYFAGRKGSSAVLTRNCHFARVALRHPPYRGRSFAGFRPGRGFAARENLRSERFCPSSRRKLTDPIRPCIWRNTGRIFRPGRLCGRALRSMHRDHGDGTTFEEVEPDSSDFDRIGEDYLKSDAGRVCPQGQGRSRGLSAHASARRCGFRSRLARGEQTESERDMKRDVGTRDT